MLTLWDIRGIIGIRIFVKRETTSFARHFSIFIYLWKRPFTFTKHCFIYISLTRETADLSGLSKRSYNSLSYSGLLFILSSICFARISTPVGVSESLIFIVPLPRPLCVQSGFIIWTPVPLSPFSCIF